MASVHKIPGKPNWFCFFYDEKGVRRCKSTKTANKKEAEIICNGLQKAATLARKGRLPEEKARMLIESVVAEIVESSGGEMTRYTIASYFQSWMKSRALVTSPGTAVRYNGIVDSFLKYLGGKKNSSLASLRSEDIQEYRDILAAKVSTGTVNTHLKVLRVALGKALMGKHIESNPGKFVDNLARNDKHERRAFTLDELKKLLENATADWRTMILLGLYTGFRMGDIASLTWANLDLQRREITARTQKTGKTQILPIATPLLKHLEGVPTSDDPQSPLCPALFKQKSTWLSNQFYDLMSSCGLVVARTHQTSQNGKGRGSRRIQSAITFHALRHTATSLLKNAGVSDVVARDIIGHESEAVSRNYTHIEMNTKREAINKMPDIFAVIKGETKPAGGLPKGNPVKGDKMANDNPDKEQGSPAPT
jgi:integrase